MATTTTGVYGAPRIKIPEGFLKFKNEKYPFGFMAGSWYHMSKCNDINNLYLANKNFGINSYDFRTAITVGLDYDGFITSKKNNILNTRFDYDYYLLTGIDVPWQKDDLRDRPNDRQIMFDYFKNTLDQVRENYSVLEGNQEQRLRKAIAVIDKLLKKT